jgi:hypothetical protein
MKRKTFLLGIAALLAALVTPSDAGCWGCYHAGFTHFGYGGIRHFGTTDLYGADRYGGVAHYGYVGGYRGVYDRYPYGVYGAYRYGGYPYGVYPYGGYRVGYYRRW